MKKFCFIFLIIFLASLFTLHSEAQTTQSVRTDNRLTNEIGTVSQSAASTFMHDTSRVGLSIGIIKDGKTYTYNYGSTKRGKNLLPTNDTLYEIGSISKTFTGTLLAQAIADKKVKLNDDIRKYLKGSYQNLEYNGQPIRIVHLVNHTSGFPSFLPNKPEVFQHPQDSIPLLITAIQKNYTKKRFLADLHNVKVDAVPGSDYNYSNVDAQLIGFVLEDVYNKPYRELLQKYILNPLKMSHTKVAIKSDMVAQLARGYSSAGKDMPYMPPSLTPAGGIYSSVPDMLRYMQFHLSEGNKVVSLSHKLTYGDVDSFAEGIFWRINKTSDGKLKIWHTGGTFGFSSYCVLYPELNTGFILLSNEMDMASQGELISLGDKIFDEISAK